MGTRLYQEPHDEGPAVARPPQRRQGLDPAGYFADFTPRADTPTKPCASCADSVFWTTDGQGNWRCRTGKVNSHSMAARREAHLGRPV
jgi:hypothetical protein